jgi:hypothetical protein
MKKETREWITGIAIGIIISLLFAVKVIAAPVIDEEMITRTVELEAGNQSLEGKRMVAAVIINRVESETFPDTTEAVLSQDGQFSTYRNLKIANPTWQDRLAVRMELESRSNTEVMFFRAGRYGCGEPLMKVGDHYFSTIK